MKMKYPGLLGAAIAALLITACAAATERPAQQVIDAGTAHLQVKLTFNPELYQKPAFFLPKAYPSYAIWIVDSATGKAETIYVTGKAGRNKWISAKERPESLPVWFGVRKQGASEAVSNVDAVTGATPSGESTIIYWPLPASWRNRRAKLYIEANISFDYNEHFTKAEGTSGYSGVNGQPSIIWLTELQLTREDQLDLETEIVGHGHVSGDDHRIDPDLSGITSAARIFQYVGVSYYAGD